MSREYVKKKREVETDVLVTLRCDLCGKAQKDPCEEDWAETVYEVSETKVKMKSTVIVEMREGECYPDGGATTAYQVDICPDCFKNELIPWLKSKGATIREEERGW